MPFRAFVPATTKALRYRSPPASAFFPAGKKVARFVCILRPYTETARRIAQEINAPRIEAWALFYLMGSEVSRLNLDAARVYGEKSLRIFQHAGALIGIGFVTHMQTMCDFLDRWRNNELTPEVAEDLMSKLEPTVAGARQLGDRNLLGDVLASLGLFAVDAGRIDEAVGGALQDQQWRADRAGLGKDLWTGA